jgi:hypothetical protein
MDTLRKATYVSVRQDALAAITASSAAAASATP